jgi:hypothetical protein
MGPPEGVSEFSQSFSGSSKRPSPSSSDQQPASKQQCFTTPNPFAVLATDDDITDDTISVDAKHSRPPPIMIHNVIGFDFLRQSLVEIIGDEFTCSISTKTVTVRTSSPLVYRKVIQFLKDRSAEYHTYQLPEEKAYRVVIRGLHPSTSTSSIKEAIEGHGHTVRSVVNIISSEKIPLPLFFVDLEPSGNNSSVYDINNILHCKIKVEEPRRNRGIPQCVRCQSFAHTKKYCSRQPRCVKCGGDHLSADCKKTRDTPATCANCGSSHPANYRGCSTYKQLKQQRINTRSQLPTTRPTISTDSADQLASSAPARNDRNYPAISSRDPRLSRAQEGLTASQPEYNTSYTEDRHAARISYQSQSHYNQNHFNHNVNPSPTPTNHQTYASKCASYPSNSTGAQPVNFDSQSFLNIFLTEMQRILQPMIMMLTQISQSFLTLNRNGR